MKILKKLHFFLFVTCLFGMGQAFAAWDGTSKTQPVKEDGYYIINTEAELAWYGANYNSGNAKLTADLDLGGHLWIPLAAGKGDKHYEKIFDGQNHIIKNLYVNGDELAAINKEYAQNLGFVGVLGGGKVLNLILENVDIQASTNAGTIINNQDNQISVGAVVGWMSDKGNSVVDNCMTSGTIKTTGNSQGVGGIVGNAKKGKISNCMSLVEIQTSGSKAYIGGIIGITKTDVSVSSCIYAGPGLTNTGTDGAVGGIAGNVWSGKISTENDFYEGTNYYQGEEVGGVGKSCKGCDVTDQTVQVDNINSDEVICALNGMNADSTCKTEPWSLGETGLSLNGYGIDGFKIVFDANGGAFANGKTDKDKFLQVGMAITADEVGVPSRENHNFVGWAMTRDATAPAADLGTVTQTDTIFAVWAPVYTVTFNVAPGVFPESGESAKTKQVASGDVITVEGLGTLPTSLCKTYVSGTEGECATYSYFTGWALTEGAHESDSVSLDTVPASDELVLYAVWTDVETYTVTYNANQHGRTTVDYVRVGAGDTVTAPTDPIADSGYEFAGWFTDAEGENPYQFAAQIHESIVLYAKWALDTFTVTYEMNGVSNAGENPVFYTIETPTFALAAPADSEGYVFEGWFYDANFTNPASQVIQGTTGDKTFYAKWSKKTYRVMYLADNNSYGSISDQFVEHGSSITLESAGIFRRAGYEQNGWSTTMGGTKEYEFGESLTVVASVTLYPTWNLATYTITYECDGCVNNSANPTTYTINDSTKNIKYPQSREGYDFGGWFKETNYTTKVTQIKKGSYGDLTLYGKWIKVYTLTYELNGGTKANSRTSYTSETETFALGEAEGREGFTFGGWFDNPDFEGDAVTEIPQGSSGDKTFYAKWVSDEPVVTNYGAITITMYSDGTSAAELDGSSNDTVNIPTDVQVDTIRFNRVFNSGKMSTVMFPFTIDTSEVHGGKFYEFALLERNGDKWTATVNPPEAGTIVANRPYLVMPSETAPLTFELNGPVTFNTSEMHPSTSGDWVFKGLYVYKKFTAGDPELGRAYGFAASSGNGVEVGQFVKAGTGAWLRPMRAYLVYNDAGGLTRSISASARRSVNVAELPELIDVKLQDGKGKVVGWGTLDTRTGEFKVDRWYDLQGRRLNGKPTTKGTYYNNGKKVIVK